MTDDRRRFTRIHFDAPARVMLADQALVVTLVDVSLKGALVRLGADVAVPPSGQACELQIGLGGDPAAITMRSEIRHVEDRLLGLACLGLDIDSITHLRQLIALNLGEPALLERELKALISP